MDADKDEAPSRKHVISMGLANLEWEEHKQLEKIARDPKKVLEVLPENIRQRAIDKGLAFESSGRLRPDTCIELIGQKTDNPIIVKAK